MSELLIFCGAWLAAGVINNLAGFGAAMLAMPVVASSMPLEVAVPSSSLIVLTLNLQLGWAYRRHIRWGILRYLFAGGVAGTAAGIFVMQNAPMAALKFAMGVLLVLYGLGSLFLPRTGRRRLPHARWGVAAGFFSTLLGALFGFNGPPLAIYTSVNGWSQQSAKGILSACFIITGITIVAGQTLAGAQTGRRFCIMPRAALPFFWAAWWASGDRAMWRRPRTRSLFCCLL